MKTTNIITATDQVKNLLGTTKYKYRIRYTSPSGFSAWSNIADASTLTITAAEDEIALNKIVISPNPSDRFIFLQPTVSIIGKVQVKIMTDTGLNVYTESYNGMYESRPEKIDISNFIAGVYFVEISTKKGKVIKKVIKQ
jgi:hypothetical protein